MACGCREEGIAFGDKFGRHFRIALGGIGEDSIASLLGELDSVVAKWVGPGAVIGTRRACMEDGDIAWKIRNGEAAVPGREIPCCASNA